MKRLWVTLLLVLICANAQAKTAVSVDAFLTPDDVTVGHLNDFRTTTVNFLNSIDGANIQASTVTPDQLNANADPTVRWGEAFNEWVVSGLLPPTTSGTLLSTTTSGTAYVKNDTTGNMERVAKDATANTYTASQYTYLDLSDVGTYTYTETAIGAAEPAVAANSIRLARVSSDPTQIAAVRDDRIMAISLDDTQADFERVDMYMTVITPDDIIISPGVIYHGSARLKKVTTTEIDLTQAGDWVTGGGGRANGTMGFVVISEAGIIQATTTAPTVFDIQGNTAGTLRYSDIGSAYYRVLGWFYMNTDGAGELEAGQYSNFPDGNVRNMIMVTADANVSTTSASFQELDDMNKKFYSTGRPLVMQFMGTTSRSAAGGTIGVQLSLDSIEIPYAIGYGTCETAGTAGAKVTASAQGFVETVSQGIHDVRTFWNTTIATAYCKYRMMRVMEQ